MGPRELVELRAGSLVIADLHLDVERAEAAAAFAKWLGSVRGAPRLVVLGDLFEFWVGPAQLGSPGAVEITRALSALSEAGTAIDIVPGNRDFLLEASFERASRARVHPQGLVGLTESGGRVLFLHGDELSTEDRGYQRLRRILRSRAVRWAAPRLPFALARSVARSMRRTSKRTVAAKAPEVLEMQSAEAEKRAQAAGAEVLVCGHAHRSRDERLAGGLRWIVLDAFGGARDVLEVGAGGELRLRGGNGLELC